ncbi:hypothetical protein GYMLUDRAFT_238739 [Collybiopsis luxurians FD-317 M1]|nr:hypothetical protein GYMLUDRAFT_238739 [Collybiopsis luxurians FD-317 M1]
MSNARSTQSQLIWRPHDAAFTSVEIFRREINRRHNLSLNDYFDLHEYSVNNYTFYTDLWQYLGVVYSEPPTQVVAQGKSPFQLSWFPGARLNYAENLLQYDGDRIACSAITENHVVKDFSYRQLRSMVAEMAAAMRVHGLAVGDRVAAVVSNSISAIVLALATASIGAIYTSTAPDMGAKGILDRYRQIQPKLLFIETELFYAGKTVDVTAKAKEVIASLNEVGLKLGILLPSRVSGRACTPLSVSNRLKNFLSSGDSRPLSFEQLPFQHPLVILYSSGTTGMPKCIVHSAGGILLQVKKELSFFYHIGPQDTFFQFTTTGWMMWMLLIGGLSLGSRIVLYDGSPFHPSIPKFFRMIDDLNVSVLGLSPRFLAEVHGQGIEPSRIASFESLHSVALGGAIVSPPIHQWSQKAFGKSTRVCVAMGGTDICSAFLVSVPSVPMYAGEISAYALGIKVEVFDESGNSITGTGKTGEMVCTRPHPTVPLFFWGDESGDKFHKAYFDRFPGVWRQGDLMMVNPNTRGIMVLGRSDGVLNPKGVRFGTGEIYSILEDTPKINAVVEESICVGQRRPQDSDERVLLFVKMRPGKVFSQRLVKDIKAIIRNGLSARHVPEYIFQVDSIPVTVNAKKIEIAVKQIVSGSQTKPSGTVANPDSLLQFYKYQRIEDFQRSKSKL